MLRTSSILRTTVKSPAVVRFMSTHGPITKEEVHKALDQWGNALVSIAQTKLKGGDYTAVAKNAIKTAYGYGIGDGVLFKPTLTSKVVFRTTEEGALSYFVGGNPNFPEDSGFAINPWKKAAFDICGIITGEKHALVMGNKLLTKMDDSLTIANFTMAFFRDPQTGALKINLHHSSLPYKPA